MIQLPAHRRVRFVAGRVPDMQSLPLEGPIGAVYYVESEAKNFRCTCYHVLPDLQYIEEGDDGVLLGSDEPPFVQNEDYHSGLSVTGTISGPSVALTLGDAGVFTVAASAFPVYAVLRTGGSDVGSRVAVNSAGTVDLTPGTAATYTARIYTASTGGSLIDDTPSFVVTSAPVFANPRYWGKSALTSLTNSQLIALAGTDEVQSKTKAATSFTVTDEYCYYAYPASLGDLTNISIDGDSLNALSDFTKTTPSVTPAGGSPTTYNLYRSTNALTGTFTLAFT